MTRHFLIALLLLLTFFSAGWWSMSMGSDSRAPWILQSLWGNLIMVGLGFEHLIGYVPSEGRSFTHAAVMVGSASIFWSAVGTAAANGVRWSWRTLQARR